MRKLTRRNREIIQHFKNEIATAKHELDYAESVLKEWKNGGKSRGDIRGSDERIVKLRKEIKQLEKKLRRYEGNKKGVAGDAPKHTRNNVQQSLPLEK